MTNRKFIVAVWGLLAFRISFSRLVSIWFPTNQHFYNHFINHAEIFNESLVRNMGFYFFLNLTERIGLV